MSESYPKKDLNRYLYGHGLDLMGEERNAQSPFDGLQNVTHFSDSDGDVNFLSECFSFGEFDFILVPANLRIYKPYDAIMHWMYILRSGGSLVFDGIIRGSVSKRLRFMPFCDVMEVAGHTIVTKTPIEEKKRVFRHSGARGDLVYGLPCMEAMGGGELLITLASKAYKSAPMTQGDVSQLSEVLTKLPYVDSVRVFEKGDKVDWDLNRFRKVCSDYTHLAKCHLLVSGTSQDLSAPWINRGLFSPREVAPIVIARSGRYHGYFDWNVLAGRQQDCVFVGSGEEYEDFIDLTGFSGIKHNVTENMIDMVEVIAGSKLFIGNQSFPYAVAEAMKVPRVLEVFMDALNSLPNGRGGYTRLTEELVESIVDRDELPENEGRKYRMTFNENRGRARAVAMNNSFAKRPLTCSCLVYGDNFSVDDMAFLNDLNAGVKVGCDEDKREWFRSMAAKTNGDYLLFVDASSILDRRLIGNVYHLMMNMKKDGLFGEMGVEDGKVCCGGEVFGVSRRTYDECGVFVGDESQVDMTERYGKHRYRCFSVGTAGGTK